MVTIAVDAMGGDHLPKPEVEGSIRAAKTHGVRVILVGDEGVVRRELNQHDGWRELPIEIVHASERITMEDSAAKAARSRRDSSMHVACRLVSSGQAKFVRTSRRKCSSSRYWLMSRIGPGPRGAPIGFPDVIAILAS